ncbi:MAG: HEPN domain-containing protein [Methanobacteriota archaeon]
MSQKTESDIKSAEELIDEARKVKGRAENLLKNLDCSGAVEASQHRIELSIKSLYKLVGLEYPVKHDAAIQLEKVLSELIFPNYWNFYREKIARIRWICKMWEFAHSTSIYGCLDIPASKVFTRRDAQVAVEYASEVYSDCIFIIMNVRNGKIKLK